MAEVRSDGRGGSDRPVRGVVWREQIGAEMRSNQVVRASITQCEEVEEERAEASSGVHPPERYTARSLGLSRDQLERLSRDYREFVRGAGPPIEWREWPTYIEAEFVPTGLEQTQKILEIYRQAEKLNTRTPYQKDYDDYRDWIENVRQPVLQCMGSVEPMGHHLEIQVKKEIGFWGEGLSLMIYTRDPSNPDSIGIVEPLTIRQMQRGEATPQEYTIGNMKSEAATRLMDSLWEAGIRPSMPMPGHDMEIKLLKAHIEDLRKLLWNRIGMEATP